MKTKAWRYHGWFAATCIIVIVLGTITATALVYSALPAMTVSHWSANGAPDGTLAKFWGASGLPALLVLFTFLWWLLPRIDPIAKGYKEFRYAYDFFWILVLAFLAYAQAMVLGVNLGWQVNTTRAIIVPLGFLFAALGTLLPLIRRNWFVGIRTPWTLSSDAVWDKTHRLGLWLFLLCGLCALASSFAAPRLVAWIVFTPLVLTGIVLVVYSYFLYAKQRRS